MIWGAQGPLEPWNIPAVTLSHGAEHKRKCCFSLCCPRGCGPKPWSPSLLYPDPHPDRWTHSLALSSRVSLAKLVRRGCLAHLA